MSPRILVSSGTAAPFRGSGNHASVIMLASESDMVIFDVGSRLRQQCVLYSQREQSKLAQYEMTGLTFPGTNPAARLANQNLADAKPSSAPPSTIRLGGRI